MYHTDLKVGEIVILKPKNKHSHDRYGFKAFIEEIIVEPTPINELSRYGSGSERTHSGVFSLYGFEQNNFLGYPDWYVGDTLGDDFERTGQMVTVEDLKRLYARVGDTDPKFKEDILTVMKNLGRMSARNEEQIIVS
ncbi:MAG: hypothetical protein GTN97_03680 [Nitrosopumilaceae archaeon]|nr:hypothetical protein [Nitrosopumilaceae archaeon]